MYIVDHISVFLPVCVCIYQNIYLFVFFSVSSFFLVHIGDCISEGSFNSWQNLKEGVEISRRFPVPTHGRALECWVTVLHQLLLQVFLPFMPSLLILFSVCFFCLFSEKTFLILTNSNLQTISSWIYLWCYNWKATTVLRITSVSSHVTQFDGFVIYLQAYESL